MSSESSLRPIRLFDDNMKPAELMLRVYRLLECKDNIRSDGDFLDKLRVLLQAPSTEDLLMVQNEIFLGLVREKAGVPRAALKKATLAHLLRQAIVVSGTAFETFLAGLLREHLPVMVKARGREFFPKDKDVSEYFKGLDFSLTETLGLLNDASAHVSIADKMLGYVNYRYLAGGKGLHVVGKLLGLEKPWREVAERLDCDDESEIRNEIRKMTKRRHDIVHRADRPQRDPEGEQQPIALSRGMKAVETTKAVAHALDEIVSEQEMLATAGQKHSG
jgi:hypothetical protein